MDACARFAVLVRISMPGPLFVALLFTQAAVPDLTGSAGPIYAVPAWQRTTYLTTIHIPVTLCSATSVLLILPLREQLAVSGAAFCYHSNKFLLLYTTFSYLQLPDAIYLLYLPLVCYCSVEQFYPFIPAAALALWFARIPWLWRWFSARHRRAPGRFSWRVQHPYLRLILLFYLPCPTAPRLRRGRLPVPLFASCRLPVLRAAFGHMLCDALLLRWTAPVVSPRLLFC